jgi:hypothetical protein
MGAKGTPGTMNKEYQEATNEYLKVRTLSLLSPFLFCWFWGLGSGVERRGERQRRKFGWGKGSWNYFWGRGIDGKGERRGLELRIWDTAANPNVRRTKTQTPSPASRPKGTRARGWCRARRRRRKLHPLSLVPSFLSCRHNFFCS